MGEMKISGKARELDRSVTIMNFVCFEYEKSEAIR